MGAVYLIAPGLLMNPKNCIKLQILLFISGLKLVMVFCFWTPIYSNYLSLKADSSF